MIQEHYKDKKLVYLKYCNDVNDLISKQGLTTWKILTHGKRKTSEYTVDLLTVKRYYTETTTHPKMGITGIIDYTINQIIFSDEEEVTHACLLRTNNSNKRS